MKIQLTIGNNPEFLKRIRIIESGFFTKNGMNLEIKNKNTFEKCPSMWKLKKILLNNLITNESKEKCKG